MVSTTIGYRSKTQHPHQSKNQQAPHELECFEEPASTSPCHAQSSDNSAETEYRPYTQSAASPKISAQSNTKLESMVQIAPVNLAIHRKARFGSENEDSATPTTVSKRRSRTPANAEERDGLTISTHSHRIPSLNRPTANSESLFPCKSPTVSLQTAKLAKTTPSNSISSGISKKQAQITRSFKKEHRGMPVTQRVVDACRPPQLRTGCCGAVLPTANRTPVKSSKSAELTCVSPCQMLDSEFFDDSDSDDCFSDKARVPVALLDAFSPLRPRSQLSASESQDFELEFGWDPVVRNAVMKNAFNGFGAIRSH